MDLLQSVGAMATKVRRHDTRVHPYQRIVTADRGQFRLSATLMFLMPTLTRLNALVRNIVRYHIDTHQQHGGLWCLHACLIAQAQCV